MLYLNHILPLTFCLLASVDAAKKGPTTYSYMLGADAGLRGDADIGTDNLKADKNEKFGTLQVATGFPKFNDYMQKAIDTMADNKAPTPSCKIPVKIYETIGKALSEEATALEDVSCFPAFSDEQRSFIASDAEQAQVIFAQLGEVLADRCMGQAATITAGGESFNATFAPVALAFESSCGMEEAT